MNPRPLLATRAMDHRPRFSLPTDVTDSTDIDWIAVERTITGDQPRPELTRAEQQEAAIILVLAGVAEKATAHIVGVAPRQVARWKLARGLSKPNICRLTDCDDIVKAHGLCYRHYRRAQRASKKEAAA